MYSGDRVGPVGGSRSPSMISLLLAEAGAGFGQAHWRICQIPLSRCWLVCGHGHWSGQAPGAREMAAPR
eukprot:9440042-Pyramimonas_sp.AAC.1